jgi:hypothetical protein
MSTVGHWWTEAIAPSLGQRRAFFALSGRSLGPCRPVREKPRSRSAERPHVHGGNLVTAGVTATATLDQLRLIGSRRWLRRTPSPIAQEASASAGAPFGS